MVERIGPELGPAMGDPPARRVGRRVAVLLVSLAVVVAAAIAVVSIFWPDTIDRGYGALRGTVEQARQAVTGERPTVTLGATGGIVQVNACDGTFTEMTSYRRDRIPPVWAAHNNCGGDAILPLEVGDTVDVVKGGTTAVYRVVEVREMSTVWRPVTDLEGLAGEFALQTCFYGGSDVPMKFVGVEPVVDGGDSHSPEE
ncbi:hypothetical protein [Microbacterium sp.]|uniref:hypothetical protein n=1 Tax=Microbacterium sp. TaxID=51671 RepID=UPI003A835E32